MLEDNLKLVNEHIARTARIPTLKIVHVFSYEEQVIADCRCNGKDSKLISKRLNKGFDDQFASFLEEHGAKTELDISGKEFKFIVMVRKR